MCGDEKGHGDESDSDKGDDDEKNQRNGGMGAGMEG